MDEVHMASRSKTTPIPLSKLTAVLLGAGLVGVEIWTNVEFVAKSEGLASSPVAMVVAASAGAAAALPFAERAVKQGDWFKASGFVLLFLLMAVYSIGASVDRIGSLRDGKTDSAKVDNAKVRTAHELYEVRKRTAESECIVRGSKCREAERLRDEALKALSEKPAERTVDSMAARISAVLPFASVEQVELYYPLSLPIALQLGGFLMLAFGFAPEGTEAGHTRRKKGNRNTKRTRKSNAEYQRDYRERQKANLTVVKYTEPGRGNPSRVFLCLER
jgi:hypothetical protein